MEGLIPVDSCREPGPQTSRSLFQSPRQVSLPVRRYSTVEEYFRKANKNRDWLSGERKILRLEALYQRKTSLTPDEVEKISPPSSPVLQQEPLLETLGGSSRDFHPRLGRTWGLFRLFLPFICKPRTVANLLYSKAAGRLVGSIVALLFGLLGAFLCYESAKVVSIDIPYTVGDLSAEFQLSAQLKGPSYVYTSFSNFYQNAKDFVNSQPRYLGRGYQCNGYLYAGQFCSIRPNFKPPLWGRNKTFCDYPSDTLLSPCGLNALWIGYDEYGLNYVSAETVRSPKSRTEGPLMQEQSTADGDSSQQFLEEGNQRKEENKQMGNRRNLGPSSKSHLARVSSQPNGTDDGVAESELIVGLNLLKHLLHVNPDLIEDIEALVSVAIVSPNEASGGVEIAPPSSIPVFTNRQLMERLDGMWTEERLSLLAKKMFNLLDNTGSDPELRLLLRLLSVVEERIEGKTPETKDLVVKPGNINETKAKLRPLFIWRQRRTIRPHGRMEERVSPNPAGKHRLLQQQGSAIEIKSGAADLLDPYQLRATYPYESKIILQHQTDGDTTPWLAPDDLRWYLWRRTAPASQFIKLYGRIDQDLKPGTYRWNFTVNEFPDVPPITKSIKLTGNLTPFGSSQFVLSGLCFLLTILYSLLWII